MRRGPFLPFLMAALVVMAACGGGDEQAQAPEAAAVEDLEGNAAPKRSRRSQARSVNPADIPLLSLEGLVKEPPPEETPGEGPAGAPEGKPPQGAKPGKPGQGTPAAGATPGAAQGQPPPAPEPNLPPRNLFAYEEDPAVVAERQRKAAEASAQAALEAKKRLDAQRKWQGPPPPPPPPQPPSIPFHFIGYFGPPEARIGVFSGAGAPGVTLAKKGDTLMAQFKVVDIGYESAEIGFTSFKQTQRIPLTGGK